MNYLITITLLSLIFMITIPDTSAQTTGEVNLKTLGIQFTIPNGWLGQQVQGGYIIASNTEPGLALLTTHQYKSIEQLKQQAMQGISEQNGTMLNVAGQIEPLGNQGIQAEFGGTLEGQQVKAYIVGLVNTYGDGVTIMAATSPEVYSNTHKQLALELANSMKFSKPETPPIVEEWKQALQNARLTYMDSYTSSSGSYGGYSTGGGYSDKVEIHLCAQGYFKYKSRSSMSIDTGGAFGSSSGGDQGQGNWEVVGNAQGGATLRLNFHNGEVYEYTLEYQEQDKKTLLNGKRYFRTYGNAGTNDGPECF